MTFSTDHDQFEANYCVKTNSVEITTLLTARLSMLALLYILS